ncbi:glycoside hydrolase family 92 protein [Gigaspora margarita]|uniref:Glycoside hydrolase family 92 protein n=1 Tax=Gigaspora margarita TaxID=4874 RepID=A0A8H4ALL7_GIGMA|nr:glycoside hydrolase family 92 protein [Gigaspora margarita]
MWTFKKKGFKSTYIFIIIATLILVSLFTISTFDKKFGFSFYYSTSSSSSSSIIKPKIQEKSEWLTNFVDPLIGIENGDVFPGPCLPFGVVKVGIDTYDTGYTVDGAVTGISHLHISGSDTDGSKYGVISQFPFVNSMESFDLKNYSSIRSLEHFEVGYSRIGLKRYNLVVELTASRRAALHKYIFPPLINGSHVMIDLSHINSYGKYVSGEISVTLNEMKGFGRYKDWWFGPEYSVYFCSQFDKNASEYYTFWNGIITSNSSYQTSGIYPIGAILAFDTTKGSVIKSRVGISFISVDQACKNAQEEIPNWDFDLTKEKAVEAWEVELEKIQVAGGTDDLKKIFYSNLYRTMIIPSDRTEENPKWVSFDKKGRIIPNYDDFLTLRSTFRTTVPLFTLFQQQRIIDITRSLIDIYRHAEYMPNGRCGMANGIAQGGSSSDMVLAEIFLKEIGKDVINWEFGYKALLKNAESDPYSHGSYEGRKNLRYYVDQGYIPSNAYGNPCSRTLEYSVNDYAISLVAKGLGKTKDYIKYKTRGKNWQNLWCPDKTVKNITGFILPRLRSGSFDTSSDVLDEEYNFFGGSAWEYSLDIPHDVKTLIQLSGGMAEFEKRLDLTFSNSTYETSLFRFGNVHSFFHPCLYHFIGKQWKSASIIRDILEKKYKIENLPDDASDALSSWFIFHAIGIYPMAGQDIYLINSPQFSNITIQMSPTTQFIIKVTNLNIRNIYIRSVKLNGKDWKMSWFRHKEIENGGILELEMGNEPSKKWPGDFNNINDENQNNDSESWKFVPPPSSDDDEV